jgi:hypothetical protein
VSILNDAGLHIDDQECGVRRFSSVLIVSLPCWRQNSGARFAANSNIINDVSANHRKPDDFGSGEALRERRAAMGRRTFDCPARCVCALVPAFDGRDSKGIAFGLRPAID